MTRSLLILTLLLPAWASAQEVIPFTPGGVMVMTCTSGIPPVCTTIHPVPMPELAPGPVYWQEPVIPPHAHTDSWWLKGAIVGLGALGGGDVATTAQAAERGAFYEFNPLFRPLFNQPALLGLANGGLTAAILYTVVQWHRSEVAWKRQAALILLPSWIIIRGYVVCQNAALLGRTR